MTIRSTKVLKFGQIKTFKRYGSVFPMIRFVSTGFQAGSAKRQQVSQKFDQAMTVSEKAHDGTSRVRPRKS